MMAARARMKLARALVSGRFEGVGLLGERLSRHGAGRGHIAGCQPGLGQIQAGELARLAALQHVPVGLLVELDLARAVHLLIHIHAVHHFADGVAQAGRILLELDHLLVKVLREHESLRHVVVHGGHAHRSTFCW